MTTESKESELRPVEIRGQVIAIIEEANHERI